MEQLAKAAEVTEVFADIAVHELIVAVLSYATKYEAVRLSMDAETCAHAAQNGHLHVLQWAKANGCDWKWWNERTSIAARANAAICIDAHRNGGCNCRQL